MYGWGKKKWKERKKKFNIFWIIQAVKFVNDKWLYNKFTVFKGLSYDYNL